MPNSGCTNKTIQIFNQTECDVIVRREFAGGRKRCRSTCRLRRLFLTDRRRRPSCHRHSHCTALSTYCRQQAPVSAYWHHRWVLQHRLTSCSETTDHREMSDTASPSHQQIISQPLSSTSWLQMQVKSLHLVSDHSL